MNSNVKALQDLYVSMGGELTDTYEDIASGEAVGNYVTIPDTIDAVTQLISSGTYSGGGSSGGGMFVVHGTDFRGTSFTSDKTYDEIVEAYSAGNNVVLEMTVSVGQAFILTLSGVFTTGVTFTRVSFEKKTQSSTNVDLLSGMQCKIGNDGTCTVDNFSISN